MFKISRITSPQRVLAVGLLVMSIFNMSVSGVMLLWSGWLLHVEVIMGLVLHCLSLLDPLIPGYHLVKDILQELLKKMFMEYLRSHVAENIFVPFSYSIDSLTGYRILSWESFSFRILKELLHCLVFLDAVEKWEAF